jgi:hypothetical protein
MKRRRHRRSGTSWLAGLVTILGIAACSGGPIVGPTSGNPGTPSPTSAPGTVGSTQGPASPVAGVITAVESAGLNAVHGFTLRTSGEKILHFKLGVLDDPTAFPPGHLAEHQLTGNPVLVFFKAEGADLVVYHLEDAP